MLFFLVVLIFTISIFCSKEKYYSYIDVGGVKRGYIVYEPKSLSNRTGSYPLLFSLHGGGGSAYGMMKNYFFNGVADKYEFLLVYPEGKCTFGHEICTWNSGTIVVSDYDDVEFLDSLIPSIVDDSKYNIDTSQIYMIGHSNGAMMSLTYGTNATETQYPLHAIGPISGSIGGRAAPKRGGEWYFPPSVSNTKDLKVMHIHGLKDEAVLINGGECVECVGKGKGRIDLSLNYSLSYWLTQDQCEARNVSEAVVFQEEDLGGTVVLSRYSTCPNNVTVRSLVLVNGEHLYGNLNDQITESKYPKTSFVIGSDNLSELIWRLLVGIVS